MRTRIVVITGLSGSGKSSAAKCFEDAGYYCVDNLPLELLERLLVEHETLVPDRNRIAVVADVRSPGFVDRFPGVLDRSPDAVLIFFEASDDALVRRFSETRRPHPLAQDRRTVAAGIRAERTLLSPLRARADLVIDTGEWSVHDLRQHIFREYADVVTSNLVVSVTSFGFKFGVPAGADLLFDVRFLPNPYFVPELREKTGIDPEVQEFLTSEAEFDEVRAKLEDFVHFLLPRYQRENRSYLTIAIGCTGGRHRSVAMTEALAETLRSEKQSIQINHRDITRGNKAQWPESLS
ncbi:MAG: RNase adapter RapZ [bacterium]|nr:RNase adapter RapZ [bacterium]